MADFPHAGRVLIAPRHRSFGLFTSNPIDVIGFGARENHEATCTLQEIDHIAKEHSTACMGQAVPDDCRDVYPVCRFSNIGHRIARGGGQGLARCPEQLETRRRLGGKHQEAPRQPPDRLPPNLRSCPPFSSSSTSVPCLLTAAPPAGESCKLREGPKSMIPFARCITSEMQHS